MIQWSPCKKLILNGLDRFTSSRCQPFDVGRSCYCEKDYILKGRNLGKGGIRRMVFEEKSEWSDFCDDSNGIDEVEIMLNLLAEDVSDECYSIRKGSRKSSREVKVEKRGNGRKNNLRRRTKNGDLGVLESPSKFEYEEKVIRSKEREMGLKEDDRREKERAILLRRENVRMRAKEDKRDSLLRAEKVREEEREKHLRENWRERVRVEEGEDLSRRLDHGQRVRKNGSSCSSYYSFSSGDFEIDSEAQHEQEECEGELSRGYMRDSRRNEGVVSDEVQEEYHRHGDYSKKQGDVLRKENTQVVFSGASSAVEGEWRKKSEKRLTDVSMEETELSKKLADKQSRYREIEQSAYGESARFDDKNKKLNFAVKFDRETREQHGQIHESETRMKSKQFTEMSKAHVADTETSSAFHKLYHGRNESSSKSMSSERKESDHHIAAGHLSREDEYRRNSSKLTEVSKIQEMDVRGMSSAVRQSEIRMKKQEDYSSMDLNSVNNREEQYCHAGQSSRLLDSNEKYNQVTQNVHSESISASKKETRHSMEKHEAKSSSIHKSDLGLRERLEMTTKSKNGVSDVAADNERTSIVTEPPSQLLVRVSVHGESASGSATEQSADGFTVLHEQSHTTGDQAQGEPQKFLSHEDALGSADRLQKSSAHYIEEYVQKVRNEISTSEPSDVKKTYETKLVHEEKDSLNAYSSRVSQSREQDSRSLSQSSGIKGPSDESWDVAEPSMQEHLETGRIKTENNNGTTVVKRTGRSLWNIIGDIVRLRWASRSEHGSTAKSGGKSSPNQSTSSETWFSGHDPDENVHLETKGDRVILTEESTSVNQQQDEKVCSQSQGQVSSLSSSKGEMKQTGGGSLSSSSILQRDSSIQRNSFRTGETTSERKSEASFPESRAAESSVTLPSLQLRRSPVVGENSASRKAEGSGSGTVVQIDTPVPTTLTENPRSVSKNEELERRKLGRSDQVVKDRFDEWEAAYRLEMEQRRVDEMFMREALLEAKKAADSWEVPVGAVLVRDGKIIARGYNLVEELRDSTAHAEINCIREASNLLRTWRLSETTLYVTLEPCPMCAGAILQARIDTVVWGAPNKLLGADGSWIRLFPNGEGGSGLELSDKPPAPVHPFHPKIVVRRGVLAAECADTMQHFFQLRRKKDNKSETTTPPSCLPISHHHPSRFLTKIHDAFHLMFCL